MSQRSSLRKEAALRFASRVQIRQSNDWELLDFFNTNDVTYSLIGDHLFVIHSIVRDMQAGPGDWLSVDSDGEVTVEPGEVTVEPSELAVSGRRARAASRAPSPA